MDENGNHITLGYIVLGFREEIYYRKGEYYKDLVLREAFEKGIKDKYTDILFKDLEN
jgi:hypothetical protein